MDTNVLLLVLIGVLALMSGVQAFQLSALAQAVSSGAVSTANNMQKSSVLSQLPSQVGGCG